MSQNGNSSRIRFCLCVAIGFSAAWRDLQISGMHIFTILTAVMFLLFGVKECVNRSITVPMLVVVSAALFASTRFIGDKVNNPNLAIQLMLLSVSAVLICLSVSANDIRPLYYGFVAAASLSSFVAVMQQLGVISFEAFIDSSGLVRPIGLVGEPDWVGYFASAALLISMFFKLPKRWLWIVMTINGLALVFSMARAAWLALFVPLAIAGILGVVSSRQSLSLKPLLVLLMSVPVLGWFASELLAVDLFSRMLSIVNSDYHDANAQFRLRQFETLSYMADQSGWFGNGISASGGVAADGTYVGSLSDNHVASNWILGLWVDGKYVAVPLIVILCALAALSINTIPGLLLCGALVNSLFSNVLYSPVTWLWLGLVMFSIVNRSAARPEPSLGLDGLKPEWRSVS